MRDRDRPRSRRRGSPRASGDVRAEVVAGLDEDPGERGAILGGRPRPAMPGRSRRTHVPRSLDVPAGPSEHRPRASGGLDEIPTLRELAGFAEDRLPAIEHRLGSDATPEEREWFATLRRLVAEAGDRARARIATIERLALRSGDLADAEYDFLFDKARHLLAIGYNVAQRRRDSSYYDLLASEARLSSFVGIAQEQLPQETWFALGRLLTAAGGAPVLLSWSGSMFEYLMPLLVMPTYENTLLDQTYKAAVERQIEYGKQRGVPWGISESGYNTIDAHLNYQYRAFGVPGLGLKRGLAADLVIAPYASALALMVAPEEACLNLQRLAAEGCEGRYGFYEAIDYTPSRLPRGQSSAMIRSFMAHHQGMSLLSLAYLLLDRPMQKRFESDPLFRATTLLLQERVPKTTVFYSQAAELSDSRTTSGGPETPMRVLSTPDTPMPEVQLLSNGRYHVMITNAGGGYSRWKDIAVTRWREDGTCDNWGTFCYIRDVSTGQFWSTAYQPTLKKSERYEAIFSEARAEFRRRDHDFDTHTEISVSPEDDVEVRRIHITNRSRTRREIEVTSYAEVVLASSAADALHPAFSNLFVQTEIIRERQAILCSRRPRSLDESTPWMFHLMAVHGAHVEEISYETDRQRFIGRGNTVADPQAMSASGRALGQPGIGARSDRRHQASDDPRSRGVRDGECRLRRRRNPRHLHGPRREVPGSPSGGSRLRAGVDPQPGGPAATQRDRGGRAALWTPGRLRHLRERLVARRPGHPHQEPPRPIRAVGLLHLRRSADRAPADRRPGQHRAGAPARSGPRLLAPEGTGGRPGDLERRSRRLPAAPPRPDHGTDRRGHRGQRFRPAGRHLRADRRSRSRTRTASCSSRSPAPSSPTAGGRWRSRSTAASVAEAARPALHADASSAAPPPRRRRSRLAGI